MLNVREHFGEEVERELHEALEHNTRVNGHKDGKDYRWHRWRLILQPSGSWSSEARKAQTADFSCVVRKTLDALGWWTKGYEGMSRNRHLADWIGARMRARARSFHGNEITFYIDPSKSHRYPGYAHDAPQRAGMFERQLVAKARRALSEALGFYDVELAGRWAWGASAWLGSGWCDGTLPRRKPAIDGGSGRARNGHGVHRTDLSAENLHRSRPHLSNNGVGVHKTNLTHRKRPAIGGHGSDGRPHQGVGIIAARQRTQLPHMSGGGETGVGYGRGVHSRAGRQFDGLVAWMEALAERLRFVRVICGDFERALTRAVTTSHGLTGVFLDPTYNRAMRATRIYEIEDDTCSPRAREWAIANGDNPLLRIVLAGLEGEHDMPPNWRCYAWKTGGGYGNQAPGGRGLQNAALERLWSSPHCLHADAPRQLNLVGGTAA